MNIMDKHCLLKWPDQEEAVASLEAMVTARWKEGEAKGMGHGNFLLVKGRVPSMHEVRNTRLKLHMQNRDGTRYVADVMITLLQPIERPGTEVDMRIDSIEKVE